jgi:ribose 5-phosphate isomerase A
VPGVAREVDGSVVPTVAELGGGGPFWTAVSPDVENPDVENEKKAAAHAAAELVEDGMTVGLGTGTTVAYLLPALAARGLSVRCVATSPRTARAATELGLRIEPFTLAQLDIAIDGADQIDPEGWLIKGGGSAQTREKLVAVTAARFVVIADSTKPVPALRPPVPLELLGFGLESTLARLGTVRRRDVPLSPDGGVIADFTGAIVDPLHMASRFEATPGVVEHGLFPPEMVSTILVGRGSTVERIDLPLR